MYSGRRDISAFRVNLEDLAVNKAFVTYLLKACVPKFSGYSLEDLYCSILNVETTNNLGYKWTAMTDKSSDWDYDFVVNVIDDDDKTRVYVKLDVGFYDEVNSKRVDYVKEGIAMSSLYRNIVEDTIVGFEGYDTVGVFVTKDSKYDCYTEKITCGSLNIIKIGDTKCYNELKHGDESIFFNGILLGYDEELELFEARSKGFADKGEILDVREVDGLFIYTD